VKRFDQEMEKRYIKAGYYYYLKSGLKYDFLVAKQLKLEKLEEKTKTLLQDVDALGWNLNSSLIPSSPHPFHI